MGVLLDFEQPYKERMIQMVMFDMGEMYRQAQGVTESYLEIMGKDPKRAIQSLPEFLECARDCNENRTFVEACGGGPNHDWTVPLLNTIGIVYPTLEKQQRRFALDQCLRYLDGLNYFYSQNHVELLHEPWLIADITINRSIYWPGFKEYSDLLYQHTSWGELQERIENIRSPFFLAFALARPQYSSLEVRHNFYRVYPQLLDRTLDAIAALCVNNALAQRKRQKTPLKQALDDELLLYDVELHTKIEQKITEKKWIRLRY